MPALSQAKKVTHLAAVAIIAIAGFLETPAGKALVSQYPHLAPIASGIGVLVALYSNPTKGS